MRWSRTFIPTLRDNPADAESPYHQLLVRGGFIRQMAAGTYACLPLGQQTMLKIVSIIRQEFRGIGAQEFHLPALHPADPCPGITHDEVFTGIARKEIRSYKDLPQIWYQIQTRFRDEARPKPGLLRLRQFLTSDSCSLDADWEGLDRSYKIHHDAFCRIFTRCGLKFTIVEAGMGAGGGKRSQEFLVRMEAGEESALSCLCGYAARLARALSRLPKIEDPPAVGGPHLVHTPDRKTIAEIADFLGVPPTHQIKSLVYTVDGRPHLFLVRGDHQLSESKMMDAVKSDQAHPAHPDEISAAFGADAGSLGPVGVKNVPAYADQELQGRANLTCGANRNDYHLQGVTPDVDFKPVWTDLRMVEPGEACILCGKPLEVFKAAEAGRLSRLGTKYPESMGAMILTADGRQTPLVMGRYEIGLERIMCAAVELHHDDDGIIWPAAIAPFSLIITPVNYRDETRVASDRIYAELTAAGMDVLLDDRPERPGVKFKDADLIGVPYRVVVGSANLKQGKVELFKRATKQIELLDLDSVVSTITKNLG